MFLRAAVIGFLAFSSALASPASELFREASFYLEFYYFGPSKVQPKDLVAKYGRQLEQNCASQGDSCSVETARPLIANMVRDLGDGHSYYLSPESFARAEAAFNGNPDPTPLFGLSYDPQGGVTLVTDVLAGGAAQQAGLLPGDRIVSVNGQPVGDIRQQLSGDTARLGVARGPVGEEKRLEFNLARRPTLNLALPYMYVPTGVPKGVFVLRIPQFETYKGIGPKVHELVRQAQAQGATTILVDVRNNGGGEETECVSAAGAFVGDYQLTMQSHLGSAPLGYKNGSTVGNDPRDPRSYTIPNAARWSGKLAVLVNGRSASCAELFAYVVQAAKAGTVVGERTVGLSNTATDFFPLLDRSAVAITYVRTLGLDGKPLPDAITPDVQADDDPAAWARTGLDPLVMRALEALNVR